LIRITMEISLMRQIVVLRVGCTNTVEGQTGQEMLLQVSKHAIANPYIKPCEVDRVWTGGGSVKRSDQIKDLVLPWVET
jgi:hypothetical protein